MKDRRFVLGLYLVGLALLVGWPKVGQPLPDPTARLILVPFSDLIRAVGQSPERLLEVGLDMLGNLVLFLPFGYLLRASWRRTVLIAFLLSLAIEIGQGILSALGPWNRSASASDVVLNTCGAGIGWFLAQHWRPHRASAASDQPE